MPSNTPKRNPAAARRIMPPGEATRMLRKAKEEAEWLAVYDGNGKLVGIVDPEKVTPISDGSDAADDAQQPQPARSTQAEAAAGEDPEMGLQKRQLAVKKGLYGGGSAVEQAQLADALNEAAAVALDAVHRRRPPGRRS